MRGTERLRRQQDLDRVFREGRWLRLEEVVIGLYRRDDGGPTRVAFVAGQRLGKAVVRNRGRRRMREAFRLLPDPVAPGADIVLVAREETLRADFDRLQAAIHHALAAEGLISAGGGAEPAQ